MEKEFSFLHEENKMAISQDKQAWKFVHTLSYLLLVKARNRRGLSFLLQLNYKNIIFTSSLYSALLIKANLILITLVYLAITVAYNHSGGNNLLFSFPRQWNDFAFNSRNIVFQDLLWSSKTLHITQPKRQHGL